MIGSYIDMYRRLIFWFWGRYPKFLFDQHVQGCSFTKFGPHIAVSQVNCLHAMEADDLLRLQTGQHLAYMYYVMRGDIFGDLLMTETPISTHKMRRNYYKQCYYRAITTVHRNYLPCVSYDWMRKTLVHNKYMKLFLST